MTYGKDMQEDKEPIFDTANNIELCILNMDGIREIELFLKMLEALEKGFPTATDLADYLVINLKIPFRSASFDRKNSIVGWEENDFFRKFDNKWYSKCYSWCRFICIRGSTIILFQVKHLMVEQHPKMF